MKTLISRKRCKHCGKTTKHEMTVGGTSHVFHLLMSIITLGLWIPVWILIAITNSGGAWYCSECGTKRYY